ncbi:hypothetical protein MCOR21_005212 [Pyricularia oryzae]|nr:hypothetical protein MCOR32_007356 [Pyricularia oryzae]KAI6429069.1 hypothetical protein MCOR21_005212 [Pyricularia oryzae]KAI6583600.1 hypothetical protein MCOR06_007991 [Pyricularia oryzae]KAI6613579.1 hypothetical protein MCOR08_010213 [Pyricularia oryzae]
MSDEVSSFLRDVEQLKGRRTEEDEARSRELEEKILQERRERQARREERARSISPQKSSPANTPPPSSHRNHKSSQASLDGMSLEKPPNFRVPDTANASNEDRMGSPEYHQSTSPTKENNSPSDIDSKSASMMSPTDATSPTRTLSWQRRPPSRGADRPKSRPLSVFAAENAVARSSAEQPDSTPSRDQIAQSLASKDPAWFRQTADRGQSSPAYRRSQVEDDSEITDMSAFKVEMPGMSSQSSQASADQKPQSTSTHARTGSALSLGPLQRLDPPGADASRDGDSPTHDRSSVASPTLGGRRSPTRPLSPTKGMGGFVQSAMMKRTDSVKRWSVSSPTGLQRADTVTSHRNSVSDLNRGGPPQSNSRPASFYQSVSRPSSRPSSRPTSSHANDAASPPEASASGSGEGPPESIEEKNTDKDAEDKTTPPTSPSKTMDPRRWSPSKNSSWLEAALNKPDSPKPKPAPPTSSQPAWMVELNKAKAQKANNPDAEIARTSSVKHEVRVGGLMRAPPMGTGVKPTPLPGKLHSQSISVGGGERSPVPSLRNRFSNPAFTSEDGGQAQGAEAAERRVGSPAFGKLKPETPPKKDFRGTLKSFQPPPSASLGGDGNELKSVFGSLRKTKTQNYVAPDTFKDNILRGKDALNVTGGPKPSVRKDEFKDAILQKKAEFQKAKEEGRGVTRASGDPQDQPIPEGLAKALEQRGRPGTLAATKKEAAPFEPSPETTPSNAKPERISSVPTSDQEPVSVTAKPHGNTVPKVTGGRLADRFNPGLANLLARGPPGAGDPNKSSDSSSAAVLSEEPSAPGPQLTHMTKGRARGPRRKAPTSVAQPVQAQPSEPHKPSQSQPKPEPARTSQDEGNVSHVGNPAVRSPTIVQETQKSRPISGSCQAGPTDVVSLVDSSIHAVATAQLPAPVGSVISLVDSTRPRSPTRKIHEQVAALAARSKQSEADAPVSQPSSPKKLDVKRMSKFFDEPTEGEAQRPLSPQKTGGAPRPLSPQKTGGRQFPEVEAPRALSPQKTGGRQFPETDAPRALSPQKTGGRQFPEGEAPRPLSPQKTGGAPRPLSPQKTGGRQLPEIQAPRALSPQKTGGRTFPEIEAPRALSPQKTGGSRFQEGEPPRALSPQKTGGNRFQESEPPRALSPQKTVGGRFAEAETPRPLSVHKTGPWQQPVAEMPRPLSPQKTGGRMISDQAAVRPLSPQKTGGRRLPEAPVSPSKDAQARKPNSPFEGASATNENPVIENIPPSAPELQRSGMHSRSWSQNKIRPLPLQPREGPSSPQPTSPVRSPTKYASEIATELNEFFGRSRPKRDYSVDAAELLMHRPPEPAKVKTQSVQLFRIDSDGKKQAVPAHQERMLFEREMYLCGHTFLDGSGRKTSEVYFWAGDQVPPSAIEDAQLFVGRETRALGGKLIGFPQGKETPEFLQALGGIVIVRRGSSNRYDSLAPSMLCGRRFQGQVTFDEVDFSPHSLCSGFPYLITQNGKCFLWKGKGSDVDELSCARLIGMDLALMGELVEVDDGNEPPEFWNIFDGQMRAGSADHWRLKPNYQKYCGRLFRSDAGDQQQIAEISPFSQVDLDPAGIYIIDCFFEMYIVVGYGAQPQYASFRNALDFAQEYAILASSMEDRPFVPISTVVLEGIPRDLKSVFRKWRDAASPTKMNAGSSGSSNGNTPLGSPGLQRGRSLRIVPLNQALLALAE